jgi:protein-S-isoprenylcysteine O-methyltransferase Ste14
MSSGGGHRLAADYGSLGAIVGLVLSVVWFVVLIGLSIWLDRPGKGHRWFLSPCLLRMLALLGLTLGLGIGYMIGRTLPR